MQKSVEQAVIKTLVYASLFDCPLTKEEIHTYLIASYPISKKRVYSTLQQNKKIFSHMGYYTLVKSRSSILKRIKRKEISSKKYQHAARVGKLLSYIPSVRFIGISGTVAALNAKKQDDIDFFVITKANTLWLTRLFLVILLQVLGKRRMRLQKHVANSICLNMFVSEEHLLLPKDRQDLYTAHEIAQMLPVFDRDDTYHRFLKANAWVKRCMANAIYRRTTQINRQENAESFFIFLALELIARRLQFWYMRKHRTSETVTEAMLAFHPIDYRAKILSLYTKKLNQYGIV